MPRAPLTASLAWLSSPPAWPASAAPPSAAPASAAPVFSLAAAVASRRLVVLAWSALAMVPLMASPAADAVLLALLYRSACAACAFSVRLGPCWTAGALLLVVGAVLDGATVSLMASPAAAAVLTALL
ncbi:hypothetical protein COO60DRAFT_1561859 [Scenedesmus sp. NREL 46B-D3]|nr:hypothetical protein COO60DRAFT_1561859 [Scenedesmus sp. NREL 46B-D3]